MVKVTSVSIVLWTWVQDLHKMHKYGKLKACTVSWTPLYGQPWKVAIYDIVDTLFYPENIYML